MSILGTCLADEPGSGELLGIVREATLLPRRALFAAVLRFAQQAAAGAVAKVLASEVRNSQINFDLDPSTLVISTITVDEGPTMKRFQPRAQGRAYRIRKRTSHITVEVTAVASDRGGRPRAKGRAR